jgi:Ser/Thr protein kinase RdoA (MazF antagonist)
MLREAVVATRREIESGAPPPRSSSHEIRFLSIAGRSVVLKVFRSSRRREGEREWRVLEALAAAGHHSAPRPLWSDLDHPLPAVAMSRLAGTPLGEGPWTPPELAALADLLRGFFALTAPGLPPTEHGGRFILRQLRRHWPRSIADTWPEATRRAVAAGSAWLDGVERARLDDPGPSVLGRQDYNRANFLRRGRGLGHIDFEDCGPLSRAVELAQLREHLTSRATPQGLWQDFVADFGMRARERALHLAARRWVALFWLLSLLPGGTASGRNPASTLERQSEHVLALLGAG